MKSQDLHIVRLVLDRRELARIAARHRLPRAVDEGYLLHAGLAQLFATSSEPADVPLHNFGIDDKHPRAATEHSLMFLLAYSGLDEGDLVARMGPSRKALVRECVSRPVPALSAETLAGFRVRVCPVVRTKHPGEYGQQFDKKGKRRSREVDAYLAHRFAQWEPEPPREQGLPFERQGREWLEREQVYTAWLTRELGRNGAAVLEEGTQLESFQRDVVHRRGTTKNPTGRAPQRPNAVLEGTLRVAEPEAFRDLLRRGVGRHRAFGFGMLLLRGTR